MGQIVKVIGANKAKALTPGKEYEVEQSIAANLIKKGEAIDPTAKKAAKAE